jgi:dolichol-phosphate mannosyltransferase
MKEVTIIAPTLNEHRNVSALHYALVHMQNEYSGKIHFNIIFVDDGSSDGTIVEIGQLQNLQLSVNVTLIQNQRRLGLGASILVGIRASSTESIVVMDADLTHPVSEIPKMAFVNDQYDIVIGSRFCAGGGMQDKPMYLASLIYNWILRILLGTQIQDSICGFFIFNRNVCEELLTERNFHGYGDYFFWFLKEASRLKISIVEVPVIYQNRRIGSSKSNRWKMLATYSYSAIKCRMKYGT